MFFGLVHTLVLVPLFHILQYHIWSHPVTSCDILSHLVTSGRIIYWSLSHLLLWYVNIIIICTCPVFLIMYHSFFIPFLEQTPDFCVKKRPQWGDDSDSECIPRDRLLQHRTLASVASGALDLGIRTEKIAEENPGTIWDAWLRSEMKWHDSIMPSNKFEWRWRCYYMIMVAAESWDQADHSAEEVQLWSKAKCLRRGVLMKFAGSRNKCKETTSLQKTKIKSQKCRKVTKLGCVCGHWLVGEVSTACKLNAMKLEHSSSEVASSTSVKFGALHLIHQNDLAKYTKSIKIMWLVTWPRIWRNQLKEILKRSSFLRKLCVGHSSVSNHSSFSEHAVFSHRVQGTGILRHHLREV